MDASQLPEEIVLKILDYLDDDSLWMAMKASLRWTEIVATSMKLLRKFHPNITQNSPLLSDIENLPQIPLKSVSITNYDTGKAHLTSSSIFRLIRHYEKSIERLHLSTVWFLSNLGLKKMIQGLTSLRHLSVHAVNFQYRSSNVHLHLPQLQSISIELLYPTLTKNMLEYFHSSKSIEKVTVINSFIVPPMLEFLKSLPNLRHLTMSGIGTVDIFNTISLPLRLESLEAFSLGFHARSSVPRIGVLNSLKSSLRQLKLSMLPYDNDGGEVVKFVFEKMKLEMFECGGSKLIVDYRMVEVDELEFSNCQICAAIEIVKLFPSITKLKFNVDYADTDKDSVLNQHSTVFANITDLHITDNTYSGAKLWSYTDFYESCRGVRRLSIVSRNYESSLTDLSDFLPFMINLRNLESVAIDCGDDFDECRTVQMIVSCLSLKALRIGGKVVDLV